VWYDVNIKREGLQTLPTPPIDGWLVLLFVNVSAKNNRDHALGGYFFALIIHTTNAANAIISVKTSKVVKYASPPFLVLVDCGE
jgi:hypothetical protein